MCLHGALWVVKSGQEHAKSNGWSLSCLRIYGLRDSKHLLICDRTSHSFFETGIMVSGCDRIARPEVLSELLVVAFSYTTVSLCSDDTL